MKCLVNIYDNFNDFQILLLNSDVAFIIAFLPKRAALHVYNIYVCMCVGIYIQTWRPSSVRMDHS